MPILVAHRGFRNPHAENRMVDFEKALHVCKAVEFDIRLSKDRKVIIFHDHDFQRIGQDNRKVIDLEFAEMLKLPYFVANPSWAPSLLSTFNTKLGNKYESINVEIKGEPGREYSKEELAILFKDINDLASNSSAEVMVSSFEPQIMREFKNYANDRIKKAYLFYDTKDFIEDLAVGCDYLNPSIAGALEEAFCAKLKKLGIKLNPWTFKTDEDAKKVNEVFGSQIYGYISDKPDLRWK